MRQLARKGEVSGAPRVIQQGIPSSLQTQAGFSSPWTPGVTQGSGMVAADGATWAWVQVYQTQYSRSGEGDHLEFGTYEAPCIK